MALPELEPETRNLIDGGLVGASNGATFANRNPASEAVIGSSADATREDMLRAIGAARRAFDGGDWSTNHGLRARCLRQFHAALREEKEQLRAIVVAEAGSPVSVTPFMQVDDPIEVLPYWAELAASYPYEQRLDDVPFLGLPQGRILRREAAGVAGLITPWNAPLYLNLAKLGAALASGCTAVLKPAPDTPWSATHLGKLLLEKTDVPAGVVNIVAGSDHSLGEIVSSDPRVDLPSFTGSTATGRRVMERASATLKRVFLELGGKSANIVLDDANFAAILPLCSFTCVHGGQGCAITTRLLLPRSRYAEGLALAKSAFEAWRYGDPTDPANLQGPQISKAQQERVLRCIERGRRDGARLLVGGGVPAHLHTGYYVEPTLFADVDPDSALAQEEIFGPVLCVIPFDDDDDAVRIANGTIYGLSGSIHSASVERALGLARRIRSGTLSVNGAQWFHVDNPFGGYKQSGLGRENGRIGFEALLETKLIALPSARGA